jgi:hypothetical protein
MPNANKNLLCNSIDATKLQEGLLEFATVVQRYKADRQAKSFEPIGAADQEYTSAWKRKYTVSSTCMLWNTFGKPKYFFYFAGHCEVE